MKKLETDREITDLIVKVLEDHKENYILYSWERFVRRRARRRRFLYFFTGTGIAATFIAGWLGFRFFYNDGQEVTRDIMDSEQIAVTIITPYVNNLKEDDTSIAAQASEMPPEQVAVRTVKTEDIVSDSSAESVKKDERIVNAFPGISPMNGLPFQINIHFLQMAGLMKQNTSGQSEPEVLFKQDSTNLIVYDNSENPIMRHPRIIKFGVSISPGITSTVTASSYNYSGGVSMDIEITRRISLSTGIQVEHQNVVNRSTDNPSWLPGGESRAMLTALDIPLNLTWAFIDRKSSSYYISGGISSLAWLGEKYTNTSYTQTLVMEVRNASGETNVSYNIENVKNTETKTFDPLSSFSFAGRLNLMIGYEKQISSGFSLHLEPFVKIPVSEQAAEGLRYTISGITCKLSF